MGKALLILREADGTFRFESFEAEPSHFLLLGELRAGEVLDGKRLVQAVQAALVSACRRRVTAKWLNVRAGSAYGRIVGQVVRGDVLDVFEEIQAPGWVYPWGRVGQVVRSGLGVDVGGSPGERWVYLRQTERVSPGSSRAFYLARRLRASLTVNCER